MKPLEIFVVDDNPDCANLIGLMLRRLGHKPHVYFSADAALEALAELKPDLILSDIRMPGTSGCDLASEVRGRAELRNVVLAAVTAYGDVQDTRQVIAAGFDYRFIKPMQFDELRQFTEAVGETLS